MEMDKVVQYFILILIFVFDPLAIVLIISANMIYVNQHHARKEWIEIFNKKENKVENDNIQSSNKEDVNSDAPEVKKDEIKDKSSKPNTKWLWKSSNFVE
jgi:hypothetical protein